MLDHRPSCGKEDDFDRWRGQHPAAALERETGTIPGGLTRATMESNPGPGDVREPTSGADQADSDEGVRPRHVPPPSRRGKKGISIYVDAAFHKRLRMLALVHDTTIQALGEQAFDLLFEHYGEAPE